MKQQLLLLEDVESLGRKGEIVSAKPGYIRNFLLPKGVAVIASPNTLRKQERLRKEREKQALVDRKESEELAAKLEGITIETKVKVDPEGHMYGSVSAADIAKLFQAQGFPLEKKNILVARPIKETGLHKLSIKLKEDVPVSCNLQIIPEGVVATGTEAVVAPIPVEGERKAEETQTE
jgi:large subunit ribosomal protein L9